MPVFLCAAGAWPGPGIDGLAHRPWAETATKEKVLAAIPELEKLAQAAVANGRRAGPRRRHRLPGRGRLSRRLRRCARSASPTRSMPTPCSSSPRFSKPISSTDRGGAGQRRGGLLGFAHRRSRSRASSCTMLIRPSRSRSPTCSTIGAAFPATPATISKTSGFDRAAILSRLHYLKPTSSFRAGYAYSNFGLTEGAVAAAKPTGKSWEEVSDEKLYKPLGMSSTSSRYADFLTHENRAELHVPVDGKWTALDQTRSRSAGAGRRHRARMRAIVAQWMRLELGDGKYNGAQLIKQEAIAPTHEPLFDRGTNPVTGVALVLWTRLEHRLRPLWHGVGPCRRIQPGRAHGG